MEQKDLVILLVLISLFLIIFLVGSVLYVLQNRAKKILNIKEKENLKIMYEQQLLTTQLEMQTQTMQHIGREIHDNVGQKLTLASIYTQQLAYENKAPHINDKIDNISNIINESLAELRQLSKSLTDDRILEHNLLQLLQQETANINDLKKCVVHFTHNNSSFELPYQTKSILLRVVQEFFQNSIKHAHCNNIFLNLNGTDNHLTLHLQDDGVGFEKTITAQNGIGLKNIEKRTAILKGTYSLNSVINKGTTLHITIPI